MPDTAADSATRSTDPFQVGAPVLVYDTGRDGCEPGDVPDAPARAFRDASGTIHFFAASATNRAMLGRSFDTLQRDCTLVMESTHDRDPSHYADFGWLTGFFAEDSTVHALVHNEYHGWMAPERCPSRKVENCWQNAITQAVSEDGGLHFRLRPGSHALVAALPDRFDPNAPHLVGVFNPTNIIKIDGHYFAMATAITIDDADHAGIWLMRTTDLAEPASWRGWDGHDFTVVFVDPYRHDARPRAAHLCAPVGRDVLPFSLGSLLQVPSRNMFVLITRSQLWDVEKTGREPGAYASVSRDMIRWSAPALLLSDAQAAPDGPAQLYPSLIDPDAPDPNYQTLGDNARLYTMVVQPGRGEAGWQLFSRPVRLDLAALERAVP